MTALPAENYFKMCGTIASETGTRLAAAYARQVMKLEE